jgi:hypothetical protein
LKNGNGAGCAACEGMVAATTNAPPSANIESENDRLMMAVRAV